MSTTCYKPHVSVTLSRGRDVLAQWNEPVTSGTDGFTEPLHRIKQQINTYLTDLIVEKSSGSNLTDYKGAEYLASSDDSEDSLYNVMQTISNNDDNTVVVVKSSSDNINERVKRLKK